MFERLMFFIGRAICHQLPGRSLYIQDHQLPICARCTGIYIGIISGFLFFACAKRLKGNKAPGLWVIVLITLGFIPLMVDGATSYLGLRESNNILRFVTGLLLGSGLPTFFILIINFDVNKENLSPILKNMWEYFIILAIGVICGSMIYSEFLAPWWVISFLLVAGIIMAFTEVIFIIIKSVFPRISSKKGIILSSILTATVIFALSNLNNILLHSIK